ncbi:MAG: DUF2666 family protein [Candidatus ainarchaeum sp.]|nr:DUF2666 family protein [Candidatus ainarchaeum sp.]
MEKTIQFVANYDEWQAVKKLGIDEKTDPKTIMEFLASLGTSLDNKIEANLGKIVDLKKIDAAISELKIGKTDSEIAEILADVNSRKINAIINEICEKEGRQPNEQRELKGFCRVYAMKTALKKCGLNVDYSGIEIPGMKRIMKKKKE